MSVTKQDSARRKRSPGADTGERARKRIKQAVRYIRVALPPGVYDGFEPELQLGRCQNARYKQRVPCCFACSLRKGGDACRFEQVRILLNKDGVFIDAKLFLLTNYDEEIRRRTPILDYSLQWNETLQQRHILVLKKAISSALLLTLKQELSHHSENKEVVWRALEHEVRATCDTCLTSMFSCTWMCRTCGREVCSDCHTRILHLAPAAKDDQNAPDIPTSSLSDDQKNVLKCMHSKCHRVNLFLPTSRFTRPQLEAVVTEMERLLQSSPSHGPEPSSQAIASQDDCPEPLEVTPPSTSTEAPLLPSPTLCSSDYASPNAVKGTPDVAVSPLTEAQPTPSGVKPSLSSLDTSVQRVDYNQFSSLQDVDSVFPYDDGDDACSALTPLSTHASDCFGSLDDHNASTRSDTPDSLPLSVAPSSLLRLDDPSRVPSLNTPFFLYDDLTESEFSRTWSKGEPLVVLGVLSRFKLDWTPEYFIEHYGSEPCELIECQSETVHPGTVADFFKMFGAARENDRVWKLKDWPPSNDFRTSFPELFDDFENAVPVPSYTRRDGVLNLAAHFPKNSVAPDLGPKMYNAFATFETEGSKGSTRLHMDIADAVNIMCYAAHPSSGYDSPRNVDNSTACAAWDIFRAEDADGLRSFLSSRFKDPLVLDPIHSQKYYLDSALRKALYEEKGIKSHRIYQRPGEAVFIPAGCAHQVCNLADCIKVAADFVSPENINRCEKLTGEFRRLNLTHVWKEDVLQLRTMMWHAWASVTRDEVQPRETESHASEEIGSEQSAGVTSVEEI